MAQIRLEQADELLTEEEMSDKITSREHLDVMMFIIEETQNVFERWLEKEEDECLKEIEKTEGKNLKDIHKNFLDRIIGPKEIADLYEFQFTGQRKILFRITMAELDKISSIKQ